MGNKENYQALQAAIMAGDFEGIRAYVDDDFVLYEPEALPYGGVFRGPQGFIDLAKKIRELFEVDVVSSQLTEVGNDILVAEFVFGFTSLRTRERVETYVIDLFRFTAEAKLGRADIVYYIDPAKLAEIA